MLSLTFALCALNLSALPVYQTDLAAANDFLYRLISRGASAAAITWLDHTRVRLSASEDARPLYLAFGQAARQMSKQPLPVTEEDVRQADALRRGFNPQHWTLLEATRAVLILSLPHSSAETYPQTLETLFTSADVNELEALYASLPLLPHPESFRTRCAEGIRTNIRTVFDAIVLNNPYPADYLDEDAWNQMVLKAVFTERPLNRIHGFDGRRNARLARMLSDYAHERWAAGRVVTPELWRAVGPFLDATLVEDIPRLYGQADYRQHEAAALACSESALPAAKALLATRPDLQAGIQNGELTWQTLAEKQFAQ
ncbi:MAG: EboA domain-containing protein [Ferruginibacter sp.]|nr:EboA domain-containing protein [Cytophagales bacterium]